MPVSPPAITPARNRRARDTRARLAAAAVALGMLAALVVAPALGPAVARGNAPLPACRYDQILTAPRSYGDWATTLVDTILRVPSDYAPPDLVRVTDLGVPGAGKVRAVMADDLKAMSDAAAAADAAIGVLSAYRSYASQQSVFNGWVARYGYNRALQVSARPGHSEHQLGLAIDFRSNPADDLALNTDWAGTPAGKWMKAHAWEYGFLMSYPKGSIGVTCYDWEPWHYRYVGRDLAATIHASGLTTREYLWANFTTAVVPPKVVATPKPAVSPAPTATPGSTPAPPPSAAPPSPTEGSSATAAASQSVTPEPTVAPTPSPSDNVGAATPLVMAGIVALLVIVAVAAWFGLRRGRSGVGL